MTYKQAAMSVMDHQTQFKKRIWTWTPKQFRAWLEQMEPRSVNHKLNRCMVHGYRQEILDRDVLTR